LGLPALAALASILAPRDQYANPYYLWIDPIWTVPLVGSFLAAAAWSYLRPSRALRAQLIPALVLALGAGAVVYLVATVHGP
jgi:hypothetical protein